MSWEYFYIAYTYGVSVEELVKGFFCIFASVFKSILHQDRQVKKQIEWGMSAHHWFAGGR